MINYVFHGSVIILVRGFLAATNWCWIAFFQRTLVFFFHISTTNQFHSDIKTFFFCFIVQFFQIIQSIPTVQLQGIENYGFRFVVFCHHFFDQIIDRILHPAFLGINQQSHVAIMGSLAHLVKTRHHLVPFFGFGFIQTFSFSNFFI